VNVAPVANAPKSVGDPEVDRIATAGVNTGDDVAAPAACADIVTVGVNVFEHVAAPDMYGRIATAGVNTASEVRAPSVVGSLDEIDTAGTNTCTESADGPAVADIVAFDEIAIATDAAALAIALITPLDANIIAADAAPSAVGSPALASDIAIADVKSNATEAAVDAVALNAMTGVNAHVDDAAMLGSVYVNLTRPTAPAAPSSSVCAPPPPPPPGAAPA